MGLIRLLIYAILGYGLYRWLFAERSGRRAAAGDQADDLLVEDPICHLYIPQAGAESLTISGTTHYFCSPECRKKFQSQPRS